MERVLHDTKIDALDDQLFNLTNTVAFQLAIIYRVFRLFRKLSYKWVKFWGEHALRDHAN
jgi:hypothetical protein